MNSSRIELMSHTHTITAAAAVVKRTRAVSDALQARRAVTARATAKAIQIETRDSERKRSMWNLLKL
jgi:hypothetical protein